jgi:MFS family permease
MMIALDVQDETKRLFAFSFVCLTAPTCGLIVGGFIVDKIGGYYKKGSLVFCLIFGFISIIPAVSLPFVNSLLLYGICLWSLLFLGAATLPPVQGIIIACLPKDVQGSGNSFVIFFYNLLGYLPAPFVYGFIKELFEDEYDPKKGSRMAQTITTWTFFGAISCIGIATLIRFRKDKEYNEKMGRDKTEKMEEFNEKENDAIRQRESSLALNIKENQKIASKDFNDIKNENEE